MTASARPVTVTRAPVAHALPANHSALVEIAVHAIFPCLVFGTMLVQQPSESAAAVGQVLLWAALLSAAEIIIVLQKSGRLFLVAAVLLVAFRVARVLIGATPDLIIGYELSNALLFAVAGAAVLARRPDVLEKQLRLFLLISIPVMVLQLYGAPDWIHAWRTDIHGDLEEGRKLVTTLFVSEPNAGYNTIQARPAGLMHANNFLSVVVLFAMAVSFGRARDDRATVADVGLLAVMALAMAKILYLSFLVFSLLHLLLGTRPARRRVMKLWGWLGLFLATYYYFFPGVFLYDLSPNNALLNYALRVADLRAALSGANVADVVVQGFDGSNLMILGAPAGSQSGYSALVKYLPILAPIVLVVIPVYGLRTIRLLRSRPAEGKLALHGALAVGLAPLITSFIGNPFFSFAAGPAVLPLLSAERRADSGTSAR